MKINKKIFLSTAVFLSFFSGVVFLLNAAPDKTVYYFWAQNCSACKEAHDFYKKPLDIKDGSSWSYNGLKFVPYRIVDDNNQVISKNINKLTEMCASIVKKSGTSNIVYFRRDVYEYYKKKNLPYYRKEEKYSRKDEPFPTPVFVIGNRVVLGFNRELVQKAVDSVK